LRHCSRVPRELAGEDAFQALRISGCRSNFMQDAARDQGIAFDKARFRSRDGGTEDAARHRWKGAASRRRIRLSAAAEIRVEGYRQTRSDGCEVLGDPFVTAGCATAFAWRSRGGHSGSPTPFYAEAGGQWGNRGMAFISDDHNTVIADVKGCYSPIQGVRAHQRCGERREFNNPHPLRNQRERGWGTLRVGDRVDAVVQCRRVASLPCGIIRLLICCMRGFAGGSR